MPFGADLRHQSRVCLRLAGDCQDQRLADRLKTMVSVLLAKARDIKALPSERARHEEDRRLLRLS